MGIKNFTVKFGDDKERTFEEVLSYYKEYVFIEGVHGSDKTLFGFCCDINISANNSSNSTITLMVSDVEDSKLIKKQIAFSNIKNVVLFDLNKALLMLQE